MINRSIPANADNKVVATTLLSAFAGILRLIIFYIFIMFIFPSEMFPLTDITNLEADFQFSITFFSFF